VVNLPSSTCCSIVGDSDNGGGGCVVWLVGGPGEQAATLGRMKYLIDSR